MKNRADLESQFGLCKPSEVFLGPVSRNGIKSIRDGFSRPWPLYIFYTQPNLSVACDFDRRCIRAIIMIQHTHGSGLCAISPASLKIWPLRSWRASPKAVNLSLNICWRTFVTHDRDAKRLLTSMYKYSESVTMLRMNPPLIKEGGTVDDGDVLAIGHRLNDIAL